MTTHNLTLGNHSSWTLYQFKKKIIKNQIRKSFAQIINSLYPFLVESRKNVMKGGKAITIIGIIIGIFGLIFSSSRSIYSWSRIIIHVCKPRMGQLWLANNDCRDSHFGCWICNSQKKINL